MVCIAELIWSPLCTSILITFACFIMGIVVYVVVVVVFVYMLCVGFGVTEFDSSFPGQWHHQGSPSWRPHATGPSSLLRHSQEVRSPLESPGENV